MNYLEVIKGRLSKDFLNVSIINDVKSLHFASNPSIYILAVSETSKNFLHLSDAAQQVFVHFSIIIAMKDFEATSIAIGEARQKVLASLVGLCIGDASAISFVNVVNMEEKNLFTSTNTFNFNFVR